MKQEGILSTGTEHKANRLASHVKERKFVFPLI